MKKLSGMRVAVLAAEGFEQAELTRPVRKLQHEGATVTLVSLKPGAVQGMARHTPGRARHVDATLRDAKAADFDALVLPGGFLSPDLLRQNALALDFVRDADTLDLPMAIICHAPWVLVSAGLVEGRRLTSWPGIRDDVSNAGGLWVDEPVVRDGNWVTSRDPHDLAALERAMVELFEERVPELRDREPAPTRKRWPKVFAGVLATAALGLTAHRLAATR
ncbi:type 1 glutamine amidotransferase [Corallococcus sp. M34]|uniref:type 1 glutamine amidotransferase domain-containing protein n=1 Tax=Citreicoccus inhibens TaxID=2849499 RepID=UPI001C24EB42|nr:type 1 glutamine amidotransferase domain-containing protein [Citreicoccus inhibens]MBU8899055.1 type 1 glutamine amidotransferase [Citreicoccus inhibens]